MVSLYLTPAALGYLTQMILSTLISGYLIVLMYRRSSPRPAHLRHLTAFFLGLTAFIGTLFLEVALLPTPRLYAVFLQIPLLAVTWICLIQFAYHYPDLPATLRREARLSLFIAGLYALWESGYAVYRFIRLHAGVVEFRIDWTDFVLLLFLVWPAIVFVRQMYRLDPKTGGLRSRLAAPWLHPTTRQARALRAFALIFLFVSGLSLFNLLRTFYLLSVALANVGISVGILIALFAFALAYLNQRDETTSFMVKLAGIVLTTVLAILGIVGWAISPTYIADYQPDLSSKRALRFTPNVQGGYDIRDVPFDWESNLGRDLQLDDGRKNYGCSEAFNFTFFSYGQDYQAIYACNDGTISLGRPVRYREYQYRYGAGVPLLMPLLMDLDPTISPGGVFARQEPDRLIVTWDRLRGFRQRQAELTFQAILHTDGTFDFVYADIPENLIFEPNDNPGASLWMTGALPGHLRSSEPQITAFTQTPITSGPEGVVQDHLLEFRQHLHRLLAPLGVLILVASLFIVISFPLMFYVSLVQPLNALVNGLRRVEAGAYDVVVPEQAPDEIGALTRMFNTLTAQVGDLISTLEDRVSARTADLNTANVRLRDEITQREQTQRMLVEQQRALAALEEREHLSRDLHDGLGQMLGYINVQAQATQTFLSDGQTEAAQQSLSDLTHATQDAHTDIRAHILGLRARETPPQDFISALRDLLEQFGRQQHIATRLSAPEPFPSALFAPAVEEQVARILQEGLVNIRKHAHAQRVEIALSLVGDNVQIVLADDGVGFAPDLTGFGKPVRSDETHFGLQIMRERAEQVGGTLEVRAAPGEGTRLLLTVPRFVPTVGDAQDTSLQHVRLLLADDHPLFLDGLRNLLIARGLNVVGMAYDGYEVQEKARALHPDVVVMDVNMPKCDGLTATRAIKAEFPEMKVLMLTAAEDEHVLFEAIKSGASGYLLKNLDANRFCEAITDLLRNETPIAPGLAGRMLTEFARLAAAPAPAGTPAAAATPDLTPQQWDILRQVADGVTYKEIAAKMYVSEQTVKYHMNQILTRLQVQNRTQAIAYYRQTRG